MEPVAVVIPIGDVGGTLLIRFRPLAIEPALDGGWQIISVDQVTVTYSPADIAATGLRGVHSPTVESATVQYRAPRPSGRDAG
jgi:hypothetical protein